MAGLNCISASSCIVKPTAESEADNEPYKLVHPLNVVSIDDIFSDELSSQGLQYLERAVVEKVDIGFGDVDALDMLLNIALREDALGNEAERIVFDLFAKQFGNDGCDDDNIALRCLKFYQLAVKPNTCTQWLGKLQKLSQLSYMAGAATESSAEQREAIARFFPAVIPQTPQEPLVSNEEIWEHDRMVGTDEIAAALKQLEKKILSAQSQSQKDFPVNFSINFPISLHAPGTSENMLKTQLLNQETAFPKNDPDHPFRKINIFPIHHSNHWMLFVAYPEHGKNGLEKLNAVVFSSIQDLGRERKKMFCEAAAILGIEEITYVNKDLQKYIPNSCAVMVVEAASQILTNREKNPANVLSHFAKGFQKNSRQDRETFNISKRREMFGDYIEVCRVSP